MMNNSTSATILQNPLLCAGGKVLVACEESQAVTIELRNRGIEAYSCDIQDCSGGHPEWHIKDDIFNVIDGFRKVVFADECIYEDWDEDRECPTCPNCLIDYSECDCPGPTQEDENDEPYEYKEINGVLYAKPFGFKYSMMIAFPECTHLALSGAKHFEQKIKDGRQQAAIDFFMRLVNADIERIAIENPKGIMSTKYRKPDQIINPFDFGDPAQKPTCLWLKNLPKLRATNLGDAPLFGERLGKGEFHKTSGGNVLPKWYNLPPSKDRAKIRSRTFPGIAKAMAEQWGSAVACT